MKRAVISAVVLTLCVAICGYLLNTLSHSANSFSSVTEKLYESTADSETAAVIYNDLCHAWRQSEGLFILLSGRRHTSSIEESLERIGAAIDYGDSIALKTEAAALSAKFIEIKELSIITSENLI